MHAAASLSLSVGIGARGDISNALSPACLFSLFVVYCQSLGDIFMTNKTLHDTISVYIPQTKVQQQPVERLIKLAKERDRSVNHLVVKAILQYLEKEEAK